MRRAFAWSNSQERIAMSRLDRLLISKGWEEQYNDFFKARNLLSLTFLSEDFDMLTKRGFEGIKPTNNGG